MAVLDEKGLARLWERIKEYVANNAGSGGSGGIRYTKKNHRVEITEDTNTISVPEGDGVLLVYLNGMFLLEGTDYTQTANSMTFANVVEAGNVCELSRLYPVAEQSDVANYTKKNYSVNVTSDTSVITIPNNLYTSDTDLLFVYLNGVSLLEGSDYGLSGNNVVFANAIEKDNICEFAIIKLA